MLTSENNKYSQINDVLNQKYDSLKNRINNDYNDFLHKYKNTIINCIVSFLSNDYNRETPIVEISYDAISLSEKNVTILDVHSKFNDNKYELTYKNLIEHSHIENIEKSEKSEKSENGENKLDDTISKKSETIEKISKNSIGKKIDSLHIDSYKVKYLNNLKKKNKESCCSIL